MNNKRIVLLLITTIIIIGCINTATASNDINSESTHTTDNEANTITTNDHDTTSHESNTATVTSNSDSNNDNTNSISTTSNKDKTTTTDTVTKNTDTNSKTSNTSNTITTDTNTDTSNTQITSNKNTTSDQSIINTQQKSIKEDSSSSDDITTTTEDVDTFTGLENAVENAKTSESTNYIINLATDNYTITDEIMWVNIEGNVEELTINGNNSILNGDNLYRFLHVNSGTTVTLNDMTINNTVGNIGGAIYNSGNLTLNNVNFTNNHCTIASTYGGGAIYNTGILDITGCVFENNTSSTNGGAIFNTVLALETNGKITINNCSFIENSATKNGGVIYNYIIDEDNEESIRINNTVFMHNSAEESSAIYNYYGKEFIISNSSFINHTGSILIHYYVPDEAKTTTEDLLKDNMVLSNVTIESNNVDVIIKNDGYMILDDVTIDNNTAEEVIESTYLILNNSKIDSNNIDKLVSNELYLEVNSTEFTNNNINNIAINNTEATIIIDNSTFESNQLQDSLIYDDNGSTSLYNNSFISNECTYLFKSTTGLFESVVNNTYTANNLRNTTMTLSYNKTYNYDENVTITGHVSTDNIYNTTINTGKVTLKSDGKTLATSNIKNGRFEFNVPINKTGSVSLSISYDGVSDFQDIQRSITTTILAPGLDLQVEHDEYYSYGDPLNYTITITNNNDTVAHNVTVKNIIPDTFEIISPIDEDYNLSSNTWTISQLDAYESKSILITGISNTKQDVAINVSVYDPESMEDKTETFTILYQEPSLDIEMLVNDSYVLGSNIDSSLVINNTSPANAHNISIEVTLSNGTDVFSNYTENIDTIPANSSITVNIPDRITRSGNITLTVTVTDTENNNTYTRNYTFTVEEASVRIDDITAHRGDVINITATFDNLVSDFTGTLVFKMNYVTLKDYEVKIENNTVTLLNYKIKDDLLSSQQVLEVKYNEGALKEVLTASSMLTLVQFDVTGSVDGYIKNNYININATILDENGNAVTNGKVIFKINGITLKGSDNKTLYIDVVDGKASLSNYLYPQDLFKDTYNITVVYSGSSKYAEVRSSNIVNATTDQTGVDISITNSSYSKNEDYVISINLTSSVTNEPISGGNIVVKINGKTVSPKISVTNTTIVYTYSSDIPINIVHNITICYSGSHKYEETRATFDFDLVNLSNKNIVNLSSLEDTNNRIETTSSNLEDTSSTTENPQYLNVTSSVKEDQLYGKPLLCDIIED